MEKLNVLAIANTFAVIDGVLHPLFHVWVSIAPKSYESTMNLFVAGLQLNVTEFDTRFGHIVIGTVVEVIIFWLLGFVGGSLYNFFNKPRHS